MARMNPVHEQQDDYNEDRGEAARSGAMARGQPGQRDGENIFLPGLA